jgi:ATP-dependent 26S proteasome regulatory subunit
VRLDLSSVLSKWLGETEKLLAQVFDVAEAANALVVLDEAESLLRQRESGASGGHALATGVAYLLTRLDRFTGVLVATTNRTKDLDEAFFRRFDDFIVLPVPDEPTRALLWRRHLALGPDTADVDLTLIAARFAVSGGPIRGAALRARAWASGLHEPLSTPIVLASLGRELEKSDRSSKEVMVEPYGERVSLLLKGSTARRPNADARERIRIFGSTT